jgi:hypothetical protein
MYDVQQTFHFCFCFGHRAILEPMTLFCVLLLKCDDKCQILASEFHFRFCDMQQKSLSFSVFGVGFVLGPVV